MAFASSIRKGQIPVGCELCKGQNKIQFKCVDCDLLMCSECKSRIHFRIAKDHQITDIKNIGKHAIFSEMKCENHTGQACCLFCQTCKTFICPKCITEVHNGHELIAEEDYNKAKATSSTEIKRVKKEVKNMKNDISKITLDEDSTKVACNATQSQISHGKKDWALYEDLSLSYDISEDDYSALKYITNDDEWRSYVKKMKYMKGKMTVYVEDSDAVGMVTSCIKSKLESLEQLARTEVIPPSKHSTPLTDLISKVEDTWPGMFCFLSFDRKRIIIKASSYEQAQQAKYMMEVNLGMVQLGGGRRNRKFASPDEVGPGPVASPSSTSDLTIRGGMTFRTKEGIKIFVYSADIGHLKVDTLVNAANNELMHGAGIAYYISTAAGYALCKECDDYIRSYGPLSVGTCCSTTAGYLPYKSIIHAVGPMWHSYKPNRRQFCLDDLKQTILSALEQAGSHKFRSIAIPSISSGLDGVPNDLCAKQYYKAIVEYSRNSPSSSVREIHFIDQDRGMCSLIQKTFEREFGFKGQQM